MTLKPPQLVDSVTLKSQQGSFALDRSCMILIVFGESMASNVKDSFVRSRVVMSNITTDGSAFCIPLRLRVRPYILRRLSGCAAGDLLLSSSWGV